MIVLKITNENIYFKGISNDRETLEFSNSPNEAYEFDNSWFAMTKLNFLKFHYPQYAEEYLDKLEVSEVNGNDDYSPQTERNEQWA